jgi:hypothetical protein
MSRQRLAYWVVLPVVIILVMEGGGCSSAPKDKGIYSIHNIIPSSLYLRRPKGERADPHVSFGGPDYMSELPPTANIDCEKIQSIFKDFDLKAIRECMASLEMSISVLYRLERASQPSLVLEVNEVTPACLKEFLPQIPVPREIVFYSGEKEGVRCYSARLDLGADEWFGAKVPMNRYVLKIGFPIEPLPRDNEELLRLLGAWSITPLGRNRPWELGAKLLPDVFCARCAGQKESFKLNPLETPWP